MSTVEASPKPQKDQVTTADSSDRDLRCCPACGSKAYHRTKRTKLERLLLRPPMARCEGCGLRFRYPGRREKYPEALKWAGPVATPFSSAEEKEAPKMAEENTQPKVAKELTAADSSERGSRGCPACGSTAYHRTKRTKLEHLRLRPPMARCEKCGTRFPYPAHRREYPEPLKFVGAAATVPRAAEEKRTPGMAEEDSGPKVTQQVIVVNYSDHGSRCCPACGSTEYHHSRRTTLDRVLLRPAMARCEKCGSRFPYSSHDNKPSDALKSGEVAANVSPVGEEGRASRTAEESSAPEVDKQGTAADSSNGGLSRCPFCGSTAYRRSRRTKLEHLLLRPKMARCRDCRKRFPYPMR